MKANVIGVLAASMLAGCAGGGSGPASVERMYVINCGENHVKDLARFTTPADAGKAVVFSNHCYLIQHAKGWMLWDTGNPDRLVGTNGLTTPVATAYMYKALSDSLKEIGVAPAQVQHFAMSHHHNDHSGNANYFGASTLYMQQAEYDAVFGPEPQKYGVVVANFEKLKGAKVVKLNGEHDVFGDGSVVIKSTPGHTPGHQSLLVRLPKSGLVLLSGDLVHQQANWEAMRAPGFNFNVARSVESMKQVDAFLKSSGAKLWINHDKPSNAAIAKAPAAVE
jgi:glyoxylase-like metal-dependent hydrolase (beta-lactamase superfamily II)